MNFQHFHKLLFFKLLHTKNYSLYLNKNTLFKNKTTTSFNYCLSLNPVKNNVLLHPLSPDLSILATFLCTGLDQNFVVWPKEQWYPFYLLVEIEKMDSTLVKTVLAVWKGLTMSLRQNGMQLDKPGWW